MIEVKAISNTINEIYIGGYSGSFNKEAWDLYVDTDTNPPYDLVPRGRKQQMHIYTVSARFEHYQGDDIVTDCLVAANGRIYGIFKATDSDSAFYKFREVLAEQGVHNVSDFRFVKHSEF